MEQRCFNDGHPFVGKPERFPIEKDRYTQKPILGPLIFCSPECIKCYFNDNIYCSAAMKGMYEEYLLTERGLKGHVVTAPPTSLLACYNIDGKGLSIEQYRNFAISHKYIINPPNMSKQVFEPEYQKNHEDGLIMINEKCIQEHKALFKMFKNDEIPLPPVLQKHEEKEKEAAIPAAILHFDDPDELGQVIEEEEDAFAKEDEEEEEEEEEVYDDDDCVREDNEEEQEDEWDS